MLFLIRKIKNHVISYDFFPISPWNDISKWSTADLLIILHPRNHVSRYSFWRQINFDVFEMVALSIFTRMPDKSKGPLKNCRCFLCTEGSVTCRSFYETVLSQNNQERRQQLCGGMWKAELDSESGELNSTFISFDTNS